MTLALLVAAVLCSVLEYAVLHVHRLGFHASKRGLHPSHTPQPLPTTHLPGTLVTTFGVSILGNVTLVFLLHIETTTSGVWWFQPIALLSKVFLAFLTGR